MATFPWTIARPHCHSCHQCQSSRAKKTIKKEITRISAILNNVFVPSLCGTWRDTAALRVPGAIARGTYGTVFSPAITRPCPAVTNGTAAHLAPPPRCPLKEELITTMCHKERPRPGAALHIPIWHPACPAPPVHDSGFNPFGGRQRARRRRLSALPTSKGRLRGRSRRGTSLGHLPDVAPEHWGAARTSTPAWPGPPRRTHAHT